MNLFKRFQKKQAVNDSMYWYTEKEREEYENGIRESFGEYTEVIHEIFSPDIHLDIIVVPPTEDNDYYTLITMGVGAYKMKVPKELERYDYGRMELVICLPSTWDIKSKKEKDYWPIRQLKAAARLPIQCDTWLGYGHTISSDQHNSPYAENTNFCTMMLLNALNKDWETFDFSLESKGKINFYQLFPLYKEELLFKENNDEDTLLDLFDDDDVTPIINIDRKNYCDISN